MDEFPFSDEDWQRVSEAGWQIVHSTEMEDDVLEAVARQEIVEVIAELTERYGTHPVLIETAADFAADPHERVALYRRAWQLALDNRLPVYTIALSLAAVLIDSLLDKQAALEYLLVCQDEVAARGDEGERQEWRDLLRRCRQISKHPRID